MANNKLPCKFYASGNCKFGNNCKFAHVNNNNNSNSGQNNASVLEKFISPNTLYDKTSQIKQDLSDYKLLQSNPVLSSYGLGFPAVNNLILGRDLSYEEIRLQYLEAVASNSFPEYERSIEARRKDMDYCVDHLRGQEQVAARYQQKSAEPNVGPAKPFIPLSLEESIAQLSNPGNKAFGSANNQSNPFGATTFGNASSSGAFGAQPNPFESKPNTGSGFGNSGFGNSNTNTQSAFGAAAAGAFGKPASTTTSAFGAPSTGSAFGSTVFGSAQPTASSGSFGSSGFGNSKPASATSAFGDPSTVSAFGSTGFGNPPGGSAFGSSGFGNASTSSGSAPGTSGFGQSGFGQSTNNTTNLPFGNLTNDNKASPFGATNDNNSTSAFGAGSTSSNPFGSSAGKGATPFGTMSNQNETLAFALSANTNLAFGQSSSNGSAFGASNNTPQQFGSGNNGSGFANSSAPLGQSGFGSTSAQPSNVSNDTSLDEYDPKVLEAFSAAKFELGKIPEVPPPVTLCQ
jgi:nucleoporin NUP42